MNSIQNGCKQQKKTDSKLTSIKTVVFQLKYICQLILFTLRLIRMPFATWTKTHTHTQNGRRKISGKFNENQTVECALWRRRNIHIAKCFDKAAVDHRIIKMWMRLFLDMCRLVKCTHHISFSMNTSVFTVCVCVLRNEMFDVRENGVNELRISMNCVYFYTHLFCWIWLCTNGPESIQMRLAQCLQTILMAVNNHFARFSRNFCRCFHHSRFVCSVILLVPNIKCHVNLEIFSFI